MLNEFIAIQHILNHMECKQLHYFFFTLGEDSWGILTVIPCERMIIGNCIIAKVKPDHYMILIETFANTENLNEQNYLFIYKNTSGDKTHANAI